MSVCACKTSAAFNGKICVSSAQISAQLSLVNASFAQQFKQTDRLNALSCADATKPVRCPDEAWVASGKVATCATSMAACSSTASAFRAYLQQKAALCGGITPVFDYVLMTCVPSGVSATPTLSCPDGSMRCPDATCASSCSSIPAPPCPGGSSGTLLCPGSQALCAASLADCAKKQPWNGCAVGLVACPSKPGVCAPSLLLCASAASP